MLARIAKIGNSQGVRIPIPLLEQTGLTVEVEMRVEGQSIVLSPVSRHPREGWAEQFKLMHERGEDTLIETPPPVFDDEERTGSTCTPNQTVFGTGDISQPKPGPR
jgi:antitoxin MazE